MNTRRLVWLITVGLMCGLRALAQSSEYLYGYILDPSGAGAGAAVTVLNEDSGFRRGTESQPDGGYSVGSLEPGWYKVTVRKEGFRTMIRFHVRLDSGQPARADFALSLGSVQETITVEGSPVPPSRGDVSVATQLTRLDIEHLPLNGRGLLALTEFAPGATIVPATRGDAGQFVAGGQRPNSNFFSIDGISANNGVSAGGLPAQTAGGALPAMSAFGSLDSLISLEAAQEVRLQTSTGPADFGKLPGAVISVSSRAGSDEFHGAASYSFRHELMSANNWFANQAGEPRASQRENSLDLTLGGPVRRNRTFFFLSYERMTLRQPFAWFEAVPSLQGRANAPQWAQPALQLFPEPNGPSLGHGLAQWNGTTSRPGNLDAGSVRIDHAIASKVTLFGRYSDSPSDNQFGSVQVNRLDFRSWSGTMGLNVRAAPETVVDFRVNESVSSADSVWSGNSGCELGPLASSFLGSGSPCDWLVRFSISGVGQIVSGREGERRQRQFEFLQSASWKRGGHSLRLGTDYLRIVPIRRDSDGTLSLIADSLAALNNAGSFWFARSPLQSGSTLVREFSAWVHDTWQVGRRLTLVTGLRWEYSPAPMPASGANFFNPSTNTVDTDHRSLWPRTFTNFAPRLGIAFSPFRSGRTVLRAGGGLYYDSSLSIATDEINGGPLSVKFYTGTGGYAPFSAQLSFGYMPQLRIPEVAQWNFSVEHAWSSHDVLSLGYVGASGRNLIRREAGGPGYTPLNWYALTTNHGSSDYHALVAQYQRRFAKGLQGLASYSWSHSLDDASSDNFLLWAGTGAAAARDHGSSDFDLRHSLTASLSYEFPGIAKGWALDGIFRARTGFPITVLEAEQSTGIAFMNAFRPDLVPNVPMWIGDPTAPGGFRLNPHAFRSPGTGKQGNLGRNVLSGFGMSQLDLALRRQFPLGERRVLQLRIEAFNALNHANFADPVRYLDSSLFGRSISTLNLMLGTGSPGSGLSPLLQSGGPRSVEAVLRFEF